MYSMSTQGLLSSVFSCSSPNSKTMFKRKLRQTRSLDPALIRHYGSETDGTTDRTKDLKHVYVPGHTEDDGDHFQTSHGSPRLDSRCTAAIPTPSNLSIDDTSPCTYNYFDYDSKITKRNTAWDSPFLARSPVTITGSSSTLFSPIKWLQKKSQPSNTKSDAVWKSEGDFTWNSMSGRSVRLKPVPLQSLSELERVRLQEVAFSRLIQDYDLNCQIAIPKDGQKRKKSLRVKLDSLAKEKSKDKESTPRAFGIPLSQVISNGRALRQRQEPQREEPREPNDLVTSFFHLASASKRGAKELSSSNSSLSSTSETPSESPSPHTPEPAPRTRRRGGVSVDCITDLDDSQSRLLEALQLSLPAETPSSKKKQRDKKLSLNPIYRQVPRVVDSCRQHLEKYGLQTVGIFRVGSSKKRVRQLREECDQGVDLQLDEEHSVHDVAALLKEFLRDMSDPLLTRELYTAFINTMSILGHSEQESVMQLLVYLLPPCNSDTLQCLLHFLSTVAAHAGDSHDKEGQEITGNKMTSLNLATIFGPNLLHKQKSSDKEFAVQSFARAEESTAVIGVVQRMINTHETLFMVPPELQNEILMSLLETDPDVVDYLLRRKTSQYSGPGLLRTEEAFSRSERRSSSDSNKASSGEVSPYDNNSPVLSERPPMTCQFRGDGEERSPLPDSVFRVPEEHTPFGCVKGRPSDSSLTPDTDIGCHGDILERGSPEILGGHRGNGKPPVRRTQTSLGLPECRPHPPVTRCSSSPQEWRGRPPPPAASPLLCHSRPHAGSSEDLALGAGHPHSPSSQSGRAITRGNGRPPPPYPGPLRGGHISHSTPSLLTHQPGHPAPQTLPQGGGPEPQTSGLETGPLERKGPRGPAWQTERWQIWRLMSTDNMDTLPETLV